MRFFYFLVLSVLIPVIAAADDPYFSQFYNSPLNLNPSLTGISFSQTRLIANYRQSMSGFLPYETYAVSADMSIFERGVENGFGGVGLIFANDKTGLQASTSKVMGSFAYHLPIADAGKQFISFGVQGGAYQYRAGINGLSSQSQWVPNQGYDPSLSNGETISGETIWAPDFHAGLMYYAFLNGGNTIWMGASLFHLNQPVVSFLADGNKLAMRPVVHAGAYLAVNNNFAILPNVMWMSQNSNSVFYYGLKAEYLPGLLGDNLISLGTWIRNTDAAILYADFRHKNFNFGVSYEFLISQIAEASRNGGLEISLTYLISKKSKSNAKLNSNPNPKF